MREKSIFRVIKNADNPYVMVDKRIIQNKQLSWKAKGILIYLLSRPDNWTAQMQDIINQSTDGESATRAGVQELIDAGYLVRRVEHNKETGQFIKWMEVYESPQEKPKEQPEEVSKPTSDFPHVGNPHVGNRNVNNTESTNINDDDDNEYDLLDQTMIENIFNIKKQFE